MWRIEYFEVLAQIGPVILLPYVLEQVAKRGETPRFSGGHVFGLFATLLGEALTLAVVAGVLEPTSSSGKGTAGLMLLGASWFPLLPGEVRLGRNRNAAVFAVLFVLAWVLLAAAGG
jgi:hypothetical protein